MIKYVYHKLVISLIVLSSWPQCLYGYIVIADQSFPFRLMEIINTIYVHPLHAFTRDLLVLDFGSLALTPPVTGTMPLALMLTLDFAQV